MKQNFNLSSETVVFLSRIIFQRLSDQKSLSYFGPEDGERKREKETLQLSLALSRQWPHGQLCLV